MGEVHYVEVAPYPDVQSTWKDITINAGASQSTLQDIKLPESAGGYAFHESNSLSSATSNRFIYWRANNDTLELVDVSLDTNLLGNQLRLRFQNTPILEGVSVHETSENVVILVATVSTVHRLVFPHPCRLKGTELLSINPSEVTLPSIFFDASLTRLRDPSNYYVLNSATANVPVPHVSCSWLKSEQEAVFVLANSAGSLFMVHMGKEEGGKVTTTSYELKKLSVMSRLWTGLVPSVIRSNQPSEEAAINIVVHPFNSDFYIFALCKDLNIRLWSYQEQTCLMSASILEHCGEIGPNFSWNVTVQKFSIRKAIGSISSELYLCVFMALPEQNQFCIFRPVLLGNQYHLSHVSTLYGPQYDLVDFRLTTSHLWTLWLNSNSEPVVRFTGIDSESRPCAPLDWNSVKLQSPLTRDIYIPFHEMETHEIYCREIFRQGRFSTSTIAKAISIYKRTSDLNFSEVSSSLDILKKEVVETITSETLSKSKDMKLSHEQFMELQFECWDRFFSCCLQYHEVGLKPLSLVLDPDTENIALIKKNSLSFLRPCDDLERLIHSDVKNCNPSTFSDNALVSEDPSLCSSIISILGAVEFLQSYLTLDMTKSFEWQLYHQTTPQTVAADIVKKLIGITVLPVESLLSKLQLQFQTVPCLIPALELLLKGLDLGQRIPDWSDDEESPSPHSLFYTRLFNSTTGLSIICESVYQMIHSRFAFCRDLLLLETLLAQLGQASGLSGENVEKLKATIIPITSMIAQAYFVILWFTEFNKTPVNPSFLESSLKQLSLLDYAPSKQKLEVLPMTVTYLFLSEQGGLHARQILAQQHSYDDRPHTVWTTLLPSLVANVMHLLWPITKNFLFPEFLLVNSQYLPLQCYIRLLQNWCDWNHCSRQFLLASCYLTLGEHFKAVDLFCQAAEGVGREYFLHNKILQAGEQDVNSLTSQYYLKVIQLFEYYNLYSCIISLATSALGILDKDDPSIPVFWSLIFKYHLELDQTEEAYSAMIKNPDIARQRDCLRQLVVVLCERKQLHRLVEFPYVDMQQDVISTLECRARSCDLLKQNYYELLYSFHIHHNNFRRAATVAYEYAMRLGQEVLGLCGTQKQASWYLAAINSLHLVNPKHAWIVKPVPKKYNLNEIDDQPNNMSPKRNSDGEELPFQNSCQKVEVLELCDIEKEYDLVHARLLLMQKNPSSTSFTGVPLSAGDTVTLLVNNCKYDTAVHICKIFGLSLSTIFEGIVNRCIILTQTSYSETIKEIEDTGNLNQNESGIQLCSGNLSDSMFYLLKNYLEKYEEPGQTIFHRCATMKLLKADIQLPSWLKISYQQRNCAELLLLFLKNGKLEDATELAIQYIDAVRGFGKEDFGIKFALHANSPQVWLPYTYTESLLALLEESQPHSECTKLYKRLSDKLDCYNQELEQVSKTIIALGNRK